MLEAVKCFGNSAINHRETDHVRSEAAFFNGWKVLRVQQVNRGETHFLYGAAEVVEGDFIVAPAATGMMDAALHFHIITFSKSRFGRAIRQRGRANGQSAPVFVGREAKPVTDTGIDVQFHRHFFPFEFEINFRQPLVKCPGRSFAPQSQEGQAGIFL